MKREEFIRKWLQDYTQEKRDEMRDDLDALIMANKISLLEELNRISKNLDQNKRIKN